MTLDSKPHRRQSRWRKASEAFILMAMTLVSVAAGFGLYLQSGLGLLGAGLAALAIYVGLISAHALVRRSEAIRELSYEVDRLENEVMRIARGAGATPPPAPSDQQPPFRPGLPPAPAGMAHAVRPQPAPRSGSAGASLVGPGTELAGHSATAYQGAAPGTPPRPAAQPARKPEQDRLVGSAGAEEDGNIAVTPTMGPQSADPMTRFWSVRPTEAATHAHRAGAGQSGASLHKTGAAMPPASRLEPAGVRGDRSRNEAGVTPGADGGTAEPRDAAQGPQHAVEGDVDVIQGMIRKFSQEIGLPDSKHRPGAEPSPGDKAEEAETLAQGEAVISASVGALRAAADEMRRPSEAGPTAIERGILPPLRIDPESTAPQPPPVGPGHTRIAAIADAIAGQKLDVYLEPILGLADRKARHYQVSLRLRSGPAASIGPEQYMEVVRSSGMLPLVDACRAARAAMVARHLDERASAGCLFVSVSAESLSSERFLSEFAEICRQSPRLRERLVFSIAQNELRGLSTAQWTTVKQLAGSGFRFAIEDATGLDLDLPDLRSAGFAYMRVAARALVDGLSSLDGPVPAADLTRRAAGTGLTLIAVGLESEEQLDGVLGSGVPLGQGSLFGPPRPVKAEALRVASSAAA